MKTGLQVISARLKEAGIQHVVVSAASSTSELKAAVADMKSYVKTLSKPQSGANLAATEDKLEAVRKRIMAITERILVENTEGSLGDLVALNKEFMSMSTTLFPQPTAAQLTDRWEKNYYNKVTLFRAQGRRAAKLIAEAKNIESALDGIREATNGIVMHWNALMASED
jgi:hypothetical protein